MSWAGADQINIEEYRARRGYRRAAPVSRTYPDALRAEWRPDLLLASSVALRLPAPAASDGALCAGSPGDLRRGAGRERRGRALARFPCRRGRDPGRGAAYPQLFRRPGGGLDAAGAAREPASNRGGPASRAVLFHAIGAAILRHIGASLVVYDCMDELSAFAGAPPDTVELERRSARPRRSRLHRRRQPLRGQAPPPSERPRLPQQRRCRPFRTRPSAALRTGGPGPLPRPRLGFYGVIDERLDLELIDAVAAARPEWQLVMVGPVVKIDPAVLPKRANIHWLGPKLYEELPLYLAGGTSRFCRSRATDRPASSARPRRRSTWPPADRSSPPRSPTWCAATAKPGWRGSPPRRTNSWFSARRRCATRSRPRWLARSDRSLGQMSWDRPTPGCAS